MGGKVGTLDSSTITYIPGQVHEYVNSGFVEGNASEYQGVIIPALDHLNILDPSIKPPDPPATRGIQPFFLGFEGEDIMIAEICVAKVFDRNLLNTTRINEHIKYDSYGHGSLTYAKNYSELGDKQFGLYYRHGKWDYMDYLPDAQVSSMTIKPEDIEAAIKQELGVTNVFIDRITLGIPTDKDWVRYCLQVQYGYDVGRDILPPVGDDTNYYKYDGQVFDSNTGQFSVQISNYHLLTEYIHIREENQMLSATQMRVIKSRRKEIVATDTLKSLQMFEWEEFANYLQTVKPEDSYPEITEYISSAREYEVPQVSHNVGVPGIGNGMFYIVHFRTDIDVKKFWIHNIDDSKYPGINSPVQVIKDFDMYPITCIRTVFRFIQDWPGSEERVSQTRELLNHIGIDFDELCDNVAKNGSIGDVRDAFFGLGVCPNNNDWAVSAALYESVNWIFNLLPPVNKGINSTKYGVSFQEKPFHSTVFFRYRSSNYIEGRYHVDWKDYNLRESEYSHLVSKLTVIIREIHDVVAVILRSYDSEGQLESSYRMVVCGGEKYLEYEYSDEPGKKYMVFAGDIEYQLCYCDDYDDFPAQGCEIPCKIYKHVATFIGPNNRWHCSYMPKRRVVISTKSETTYLLRLVHQINRQRYHQIDIVDVNQTYIIQDRGETAVKNISPDNDKFVYPLAVEVVNKLTLMEKNALLGESAYLFFYAVKWQHLEWYETGAFQGFLGFLGFAISMVITVVSFGSMSWVGLTTMQILTKVLSTVIIPVALNAALKAIDALVGDPLFKTILSVGVMAMGMLAGAYFAGGMSFQNVSLDLGLATKMAQLPMKAFDIYNNSVFQNEAAELAQRQEAFNSAYTSRMDSFAAVMESLKTGIDTAFLANLSYDGTSSSGVNARLVKPEDYYTLAFANDTPSICSRETFCKITVDNFCKNSLSLG